MLWNGPVLLAAKTGDIVELMARINKQTPDAALLTAYLAGNLDAWDLLVDRYEGLVFSVPRRMGLSSTDTEDIAQMVFIALLNNLERLRDDTRLGAWLMTTARRESWLTARRNQSRAAPLPKPEMLEALPETEEAALPEAALMALQEQHLVLAALSEMPERCHTLLLLLYVSDPPYPYAAVAERLQVPLGSIGPQRARCLERLKKILVARGY